MKKHLIPFIACSPFIPVSIYSQISQHPNIIIREFGIRYSL